MFKWFYNISWSLQLAVGLVLFGVTAVLEAMVLAAYLESLWLGVFVAAGLEAAKVLTIVLYRILNGHAGVPVPARGALAHPGLPRDALRPFRRLLRDVPRPAPGPSRHGAGPRSGSGRGRYPLPQ
jgi:hypothetical protein